MAERIEQCFEILRFCSQSPSRGRGARAAAPGLVPKALRISRAVARSVPGCPEHQHRRQRETRLLIAARQGAIRAGLGWIFHLRQA